MQQYGSITGKLSASALEQIGRFFDQSHATILSEILQNARRAGATEVEIDTNGTTVSITDNGCGIDDPQTLLTFRDSEWKADVYERESPAGCGFFSCIGADVTTIESRDWTVELKPECFTGRLASIVHPSPAPREVGTRVTVVLKGTPEQVRAAVRDAVRHYPIPVTLDGRAASQLDFLGGSRLIRQFDGYRIGLTHDRYTLSSSLEADVDINFHGHKLTVTAAWPALGYWARHLSRVTRHIRVDITHAAALDMVYPTRQSVQQNAKWDRLAENILRAIAEDSSRTHVLPFELYEAAKERGYQTSREDSSSARDLQELPCLYTHEHIEMNLLSPPDDPPTAVISRVGRRQRLLPFIAREFAAAGSPVSRMRFCRAERIYEGYTWYDGAPGVEEIRQWIRLPDGRLLQEDPDLDSQWFDARSIPDGSQPGMTLVMDDGTEHEVETPLVVDTSYRGCSDTVAADDWYATRKALVDGVVNADLLEAALFCADEDASADSDDTQMAQFSAMLADEITRRVDGDVEGYKSMLLRSINAHALRSLCRELKVDRVVLRVDDGLFIETAPSTTAP